MNRRSILVGIIGCGAYGSEHARVLSNIVDVSIRAVCDIDAGRARTLGEASGASYFSRDPEELIRDEAIDVIYICTHHDSHASIAIQAASYGKHIFIEKPMALTVHDSQKIVDAVERAGVLCMVGFKLRFYPLVNRLRTYIPTPRMTIAHGIDDRWPDDFWANDPMSGGGNVISEGCHVMDLVYYLNQSEPVRIHAEGGNYQHPELDIIDTIASTITFENGSVASVVVADIGLPPFISKFSFQSMDGKKSAHLYNRLKSLMLYDGIDFKGQHDQEEMGVVEENRYFIRAVQAGMMPSCNHIDGLRATAMIQATFESLQSGNPVMIKSIIGSD